ncbi:MAG: DUF4838 domain-containing protein [Bacteroidales bacterium]|nr:DUF4838 domain-containing protein [Bacteroidales bacterium]
MSLKRILPVVLTLLLLSSCNSDIQIASGGESDYRIVVPAKATRSELKAASYLQRYVEKVNRARIPIVRDREESIGKEISIGQTNRITSEVISRIPDLEEDGFSVQSSEKNIFFLGGTQKGVMYGVSSFLERFLSVQILSSEVEVWKAKKRINIPDDLNWTVIPPIHFRSTHYRDTWDPFFAGWHKLHHLANGGHPDWGYWCHTFNQLVPPDEYYESHPEYYAEINGNRVATQLCLTNQDVLKIAVQNLRKAIDEKPDVHYWSVSQNDNVSYCQCENCQKIDKAEGSPIGSLLSFVNAVADSFPDRVISTLAYQYSRKPPINLVPRENVNIMLCTIELDRSESISTSVGAASFREDLEGWGRITDDILLWDYVIQFENLVSPFPNFHVLKPNLQYFVENSADKHFQQGNREVGGEFAELRGYLISKLLWNPSADVDSLMDDFLEGYYGKADRYIRKYIDVMHDELKNSGLGLGIFGHPFQAKESYLSPAKIKQYIKLFDKAEQAVRKSPEYLERVQIARLPLQYARIEIATRMGTAEGGMYIRDDKGQWIVDPQYPKLADTLVTRALRQGVTRFKEWHTTPDEYLKSLKKSWDVDMHEHLAMDMEVQLFNQASSKYAGGNAGLLTDGLRGPLLTFAYNWLGFEGNEFEAILDFGKKIEFSSLSTSWLQDLRSWAFLPETISYFGSDDKHNWTIIEEVSPGIDPKTSGVFIHDFSLELSKIHAFRYLKIKSKSYITCPEWHPGAGGKAWIFVDEIIVK